MMNKQHPLYREDLEYILKASEAEKLQGKTVLITGATGLIGVQMIDALLLKGGIKVIATGRSIEKAKTRLGEHFRNPDFIFIEQDASKPFSNDLNPDFIIPLASNTHPMAYSSYPIETIEINFEGARNALDLAVQTGAVVLYPSSVEVYGNARGTDIFTEDYTGALNLSNARACYTESKRVCEALCQSYSAERGAKVRIARLSRVFGPTMLPSDTKASSQFINNALKRDDIVLKSKGEQYYSYTYSADAVAALLFIMINGEDGQAYNISADGCNVHLKDFAGCCAEVCGKKVIFDLPSDTEQKGYSIATQAILSNQKLQELGFKARFNIEEAVSRTVKILQ